MSLEKMVRISHKCVEPWMSRGIEAASRIQKYKEYRNHYNKLKRTTQTSYYNDKIKECKNKTKELWKVINKVIGKMKHRGSIISYITIDGLKTYNPKCIANEFGQFYSKLGENLASKI